MMVKDYPIKIKWSNIKHRQTSREYEKYEGRLIETVYCVQGGNPLCNRFPKKGIVTIDVNGRVIIVMSPKSSFLVYTSMRFKVFSEAEEIIFKLENDL